MALTKVIIAGSRHFSNYDLLKFKCNRILRGLSTDEVQIVSGGAKGADKLGEQYAKEHGFDCVKFPANWDKHGKAAGPIRNKQMAEYSDCLIAFWNGSTSGGTSNMIKTANKLGLEVRIIKYLEYER
jgi:cysteine synthase